VEALKTLQASLPPNTSQVRALRDEDLPNSGPLPLPLSRPPSLDSVLDSWSILGEFLAGYVASR
jgi:hypothetical protein